MVTKAQLEALAANIMNLMANTDDMPTVQALRASLQGLFLAPDFRLSGKQMKENAEKGIPDARNTASVAFHEASVRIRQNAS